MIFSKVIVILLEDIRPMAANTSSWVVSVQIGPNYVAYQYDACTWPVFIGGILYIPIDVLCASKNRG
jgi:hypothetical protein